MKWFLLSFILLILSCQKSSLNTADFFPLEKSSGIVGGVKVISSSPYKKFSIYLESEFQTTKEDLRGVESTASRAGVCSASLVAHDIVITSAHCVNGAVAVRFLFDVNLENVTAEKQRIGVKIKFHPRYKPNVKKEDLNDDVDLVLIKLNQPAPQGHVILKLPDENTLLGSELNLLALGYGRTLGVANDPNVVTNQLHYRMIQVKNLKAKHTHFAVRQENGGICYGDSGGPLIYGSSVGAQLVAIADSISQDEKKLVSFKIQDPCKYIGIYTNITPHVNWIRSTVQQLQGKN